MAGSGFKSAGRSRSDSDSQRPGGSRPGNSRPSGRSDSPRPTGAPPPVAPSGAAPAPNQTAAGNPRRAGMNDEESDRHANWKNSGGQIGDKDWHQLHDDIRNRQNAERTLKPGITSENGRRNRPNDEAKEWPPPGNQAKPNSPTPKAPGHAGSNTEKPKPSKAEAAHKPSAGHQAPPPAKPALSKLAGQLKPFLGKNKKGLFMGGGAAGFIALLIAAFFALLPLRIEAMMKNIFSDHFSPIENALERREEKIFFKYLIEGSAASGRPIVATGNPLRDLYRTWRIGKFEDRLAEHQGLKITGDGKGRITVTSPQGTHDFRTVAELEQYFDRDLSRAESKAFLKRAIKSETKWFQVMKRHHLRIWMRNAYGIRWWKVFDKKKDTDAKTAEANLDETVRTRTLSGYKTRLLNGLACIMGESARCPDKNKTASGSGTDEGKIAGNSAGDAINDAGKEAKTTKEFETKLLEKLLASKAVPVIGWIDLAARIDDFIYNDKLDPIIQDIREVQYAIIFSSWLTIADQIKEGDVTSFSVQAAMKATETIAKTCAYQRLFSHTTKNKCVGTPDNKKVASTTGASIAAGYKLDPTSGPRHSFLSLYFSTIGQIYGIVGDWLGSLISSIPLIGSLINDAASAITGYLLDMLKWFFGVVFDDPNQLMNILDVGGDVVGNDFNHNAGGVLVPKITADNIDAQIAHDKARQTAFEGPWYQLASTDNPKSLVMQAAMAMPSSPEQAIGSGFGSLMATVSNGGLNLLQFAGTAFISTLQPAYAAAPPADNGVKQYRFHDAALDQDVNEGGLPTTDKNNDGLIDQNDCDDTPPGVDNICRLDMIAIGGAKSTSSGADDGGLGGGR